MERSLTLTVPRPPSTKNSRRLGKVGGKIRSFPSKESEKSRKSFRAALIAKLRRLPIQSLFGDEDIGIRAQHLVATDELRLEVYAIGPRQRGKTGRKCDLQNILEGPLDWMQGIVYDDDRQVCVLEMERVRT